MPSRMPSGNKIQTPSSNAYLLLFQLLRGDCLGKNEEKKLARKKKEKKKKETWLGKKQRKKQRKKFG
jgi:hypothetical protein